MIVKGIETSVRVGDVVQDLGDNGPPTAPFSTFTRAVGKRFIDVLLTAHGSLETSCRFFQTQPAAVTLADRSISFRCLGLGMQQRPNGVEEDRADRWEPELGHALSP